jgi:peptidoglycan/xylan/chitin deacetylase (PgdA/CDA1 family)
MLGGFSLFFLLFFTFLFILLFAFWSVYCLLPTLWYKRLGNHRLCLERDAASPLLLTFDDGPDGQYTAELLNLLRKERIKALFFILLDKALARPQLVERILAEGHQLGLHGLDHKSMWRMSPAEVKSRFELARRLCRSRGWQPAYYRPPHGRVNLCTMAAAKKTGFAPVFWTVMAQDWQPRASAASIYRRLQSRVKPGAIICLHDSGAGTGGAADGPAKTIEALGRFLPEMKEQGYRFMTPAPEGR